MQFNCSLEINRPIEKVMELFDTPDNMKKWQPDPVSFEHIKGEPGQSGAISKLAYKNGRMNLI